MGQVHITEGDLHNEQPVDADALRALLQRLEGGINAIDSSQINSGAVGSDQIAVGAVKMKNLFADIAYLATLPNGANVAFNGTSDFKITTTTDNADTGYAVVKGSAAHDYLVPVTPLVDCYALLCCSIRLKVTDITPDSETILSYVTVGMHAINNTVGNENYGKIIDVENGVDLESDYIGVKPADKDFERSFDITRMVKLNAGQAYNFATVVKAKAGAASKKLVGSVVGSPRFTSMSVLLFPRGA